MSDSPKERRRRLKPDAPTDAERAAAPDDARAADDAGPSPKSRRPASASAGAGGVPLAHRAVWPLITGIAVGFAMGRESIRFGLGEGSSQVATAPSSAPIGIESAHKTYARTSDFPAGWVKDTDLSNGATLFAGLTDAQKAAAMQALNERNCECGCGMGALATCLQKDPNCPRSPLMAKLAADLAKQGKGASEIEDAIDAKQKEMGAKPAAAPAAAEPSGPRRVELAAWNPRLGPKAAKVTVVEFSDFQ